MKYLDEYRDAETARRLAAEIKRSVTRPWQIMEICGGQTHSIMRFGLDQLLPESLTLIHGPGCPVCVTPIEILDKAMAIAARPEAILCSFGDMLRVPGSKSDLLSVKAAGGDVRIVYSPLDAVRLAREHPEREVVFFAVGFETTAPANAMAALQAEREKLQNFSLLVSHVLVPPAISALLSSPDCRVQGFLAAGHVCAIMGMREYEELASKFQVPIVATGFEPVDILRGVLDCVRQLEAGQIRATNQYSRCVRADGNAPARRAMEDVFEVCDRTWRGLGEIPSSGLKLNARFAGMDAEKRFAVDHLKASESELCISGEILMGLRKPHECPAFGVECTPDKPLGAPMVSTEGACAAYFRYRRNKRSA
ncbi:hydrogenase formation protein HypD [Candidatus Sumerlaeota bacterium]|nr:hydrogenase formation protein HypD [Candidatus Sumerlaeota bacterium]